MHFPKTPSILSLILIMLSSNSYAFERNDLKRLSSVNLITQPIQILVPNMTRT